MPNRRRRATANRVEGRRRAQYLARRYGVALRDCRRALRLTQAEASRRAGVSQSFWSRLELGRTTAASLETLTSCAAAVSAQTAMFIEARPGADLPRDIEHLRRQELVLRFARGGGWTGQPERPVDPSWSRSRSVDVALERVRDWRHEIAVVEIEDWLGDLGAVQRGLQDKVSATRRQMAGATVSGLLLIRRTARNRGLVTELRDLFAARFPAAGSAWRRALSDPAAPMPDGDGWLWTSSAGEELIVPRRPRQPGRGG